MMVAKQPAMPVVMPAATIMPVSGMVVARMGIMTAAMACVRPAGGLPGVRMLVTSAVRAVRGWGGGVVMGVVMAIRAMVVLAFAHRA